MIRISCFLFAAALALAVVPAGRAATFQIQLGGVDIAYDGSQLVDADVNGNDPAPLTNATFMVDGDEQSEDKTDVTLDLLIPDVTGIPVGGGEVTSAADGSFDLQLGGGEFLTLTLNEASIIYKPIPSVVEFVFGGAAASINGQQLPDGLVIGAPVSVSFSTQLDSDETTDDDMYLTGFEAAGTGEVQAVPEPASMALLGIGGLALLRRRCRG